MWNYISWFLYYMIMLGVYEVGNFAIASTFETNNKKYHILWTIGIAIIMVLFNTMELKGV